MAEKEKTKQTEGAENKVFRVIGCCIFGFIILVIIAQLIWTYSSKSEVSPVVRTEYSNQSNERSYPYIVKVAVNKYQPSPEIDIASDEHVEFTAIENDLAFDVIQNRDTEHPVQLEARTDPSFHYHDSGTSTATTIALIVDKNSTRADGTVKCVYTKRK